MHTLIKKTVAFTQHFSFIALMGSIFIGSNGCMEQPDPSAGVRAPHAASSALGYAINESDSGTDEVLCGNGTIDSNEQCDPSTPGWSALCDQSCQRTVYENCDDTASCGGSNALCASYVAQPGTQFCAPFCQTDTACPVVPGFQAACNLAWCAVLCNDFGQCPNGMACIREVTFLDFQGNERDPRSVCAPVPATPIDPTQQ